MKYTLSTFLAVFLSLSTVFAKPEGYKITVNFSEPISDKMIYLAHYFGKGLPTIYQTDSAKVINGKTAVFNHKDSILGGIYLVMYNNRTAYFQMLLDNGYDVTANVGKDGRAHYTSNKINQDFEAHETFMVQQMERRSKLMESYKTAKNRSDSAKIEKELEQMQTDAKNYRRNYVKKTPKSLLTQVFNAMDAPDIPTEKHYLASGEVDSLYAFRYYKNHFWDKFDLTDNRLAKTPILEGRLNEYFSRLVTPIPDTINMEMDKLLAKAAPAPEVYKYILHWLGNYTSESRIMGVDASFIHLVENYYGKGKAFWLDSAGVARYLDRAKKIAPNVLGNPAPELTLYDLYTLQPAKIYDVKSPYTLLIIWSPSCGHCMEELPKVADLYNKELKKRGVKVFSIPTDGDAEDIKKIIKEHGVAEWKHAVDPNNTKEYQAKYDAYTTPKMYLLDENKIIVGKGLSHDTILKVLEFEERKHAAKK